MDKQKQDYILRYSSRLMTKEEKLAWRHYSTNNGRTETLDKNNPHYNIYLKKGWISEDPNVLKLLEDGIEKFRERTAKRILRENGSDIVFNYCPKCEGLTRTPLAKQCPHCFHNWHSILKTDKNIPWVLKFYQGIWDKIVILFKGN